MKFTRKWLNAHVKINMGCELLAQTLSSIGLEVEEVVDKEKIYSQFLIAEIIEAKQHPNADALRVCIVDNGKEHLQIVCGAKNARAGIKVVLAPVGCVIPQNGMIIKACKIRDVESHGMLCSEFELALTKDDSDGIMEIIASSQSVGMDFAEFTGLNDKLIDINITPNRGDCASVRGIARDVAAAGIGELVALPFDGGTFDFEHGATIPFNVDIKDKAACQEIAFCYIKGVDNTLDTNKNITSIFRLLGIKSHTPLIYISNFSMYEYGRPNHIYDADKIEGDILVRFSREGEKFTSLEEKDYVLPDGILVIADDQKILAIAGVIGGSSSKVDQNTKNVVIEVANFHPDEVAKSTRILHIKTESSFRFERRVDYASTSAFMYYIVDLIRKSCGGQVAGSLRAYGSPIDYIDKIQLNYTEIEKLLGIKVDQKKANDILQKLGFTQVGDSIVIPTWRQGDIIDNADIAEEIIRLQGINADNKIAHDYSYSIQALKVKGVEFNELFRDVLVARGVDEAISWSFINQDHAKLFTDGQLKKLVNPISQELAVMRCSIIPGLLQVIRNNMARGLRDFSFFEIGKIFHGNEENCLAVVRIGDATQNGVLSRQRKFDFYDVKDDLYALLREINISEDNLLMKKAAPSYYHPGKSASIYIGKQLIAYVGELHPKVAGQFNMSDCINCMELFCDKLPQKNLDKRTSLSLSEFQSVNRDFAFFIDDDVESMEVIKAVKSLKIDIIDKVSIFDVYKDKNSSSSKKSVAFSIRLQPKTKTLVEEDIENISKMVVHVIKEKLNGELRGK
ncbi:phenylalanine--tRNA ligase subunit beta [Candidatus Bandiella euplotis]|uniref:Phenylalanine--tRNA ligase beta subunit n=1 Tax=Candidatus Bandiella euplotis TaxID=1664265 RepID=A0ABZ0UME1_9RICK|nr:phenylalanine--tRNA ligase subunit beta [Candidatus Bandiella woodruffii]WPX96892.1 Phenylalanine--tRNA ligase beta subunit [Candidatus Bandiella woodruffii]